MAAPASVDAALDSDEAIDVNVNRRTQGDLRSRIFAASNFYVFLYNLDRSCNVKAFVERQM
jgi:hypothetical protein